MNWLKFLLSSLILGLILISSPALAKKAPKPVLDVCPCWTAEDGWEDAHSLIDSTFEYLQYFSQNDHYWPEPYVTVGVTEKSGDCVYLTLRPTDPTWRQCRSQIGIMQEGECTIDSDFTIAYLSDDEIYACDVAMKYMFNHALEFESLE